MSEIWKDIPGFEGIYQVSDMGRVKSLERRVYFGNAFRDAPEIILKQLDVPNGYKQIALSKNGKKKRLYVHRVVATAFVPNINGYPQVNHKNESKTDNRAVNLEWCTPNYNVNYGTCIKRRAEKTKIKLRIPIVQMDLDGEMLATYVSISDMSRITGFDKSLVWRCCKNKAGSETAYGYKWKFYNAV